MTLISLQHGNAFHITVTGGLRLQRLVMQNVYAFFDFSVNKHLSKYFIALTSIDLSNKVLLEK